MCQGRLVWDPLWLPAWTNTPPQPRWTVTSAGPLRQHSHWPIVLPLLAVLELLPSPPTPMPAPSNHSGASAGLCTLSRFRGSVLQPRWVPQQSGCSTSTSPIWGTFLQAGTKTEYCEKAILLTKIFQLISVIRILFLNMNH